MVILLVLVMSMCAVMVTARSPPVIPPGQPDLPDVDQTGPNTGLNGLSDGTSDVCRQPKTAGPCDDSLKRYFYNPRTMTCEEFEYGGCWGNDNNFATFEACLVKCVMRGAGDGHPPGVFLDMMFPEDK